MGKWGAAEGGVSAVELLIFELAVPNEATATGVPSNRVDDFKGIGEVDASNDDDDDSAGDTNEADAMKVAAAVAAANNANADNQEII